MAWVRVVSGRRPEQVGSDETVGWQLGFLSGGEGMGGGELQASRGLRLPGRGMAAGELWAQSRSGWVLASSGHAGRRHK
jgi:hypothetical protein